MKHEAYQWPRQVQPPVADKKPQELSIHGDTRIDHYYWLSDYFKKGPDSARVLDYLQAENAYLETMMAGTKEFREQIFREMKNRIKEKDESVPYKVNGYWYYTREEEGKQYSVYCRKKEHLNAEEEVIHDSNRAAAGKTYYHTDGLVISDDNQWMAIGEDDVSRRLYTLRFKHLVTGEYLPETIMNTEGGAYAWAKDNKTVFYVLKDITTLLGYQVWRHEIGTEQSLDIKVYEETDNRHYLSVGRTKSKKYILIESELSEQESEHRFLDASTPTGEFSIFQPRIMGLVYDIEHYRDKFYIRTNLEAANFRLMETDLDKSGKENWKEVIAHRPDVYLAGLTVFRDHLVLSERKEGLVHIRIIHTRERSEHYIRFGEPAWLAAVGNNPDFNTHILRINYSSLVTPGSVYDYNMDTREQELKKQQEVVGGYDKTNYVTERFFVIARDGAKIPVSLVYKKDLPRDGERPLLLYAYGSYGYSMETYFSSNRLSLLDRGFIYAIAHVRGGQEMGRDWYEQGKMMYKKNSFFDFIDCAEWLIRQKYTSPEHLYAIGGSAGGLLIGAIINLRPDLWHGVIASVPFVDVLTTMGDTTIPLTTGEFLEWGDPAIREEYWYMRSYSPIDNVEKKEYPNLLVTTGLHDSQVQYFEPAKWVAKLRALKTDNNIMLLHTNMEAGHGGASGRFDYLKDVALQYVFLLALEGISN